jgi:hypothetical protein
MLTKETRKIPVEFQRWFCEFELLWIRQHTSQLSSSGGAAN